VFAYIAQRLALTVPVVVGILLVTFAIKSLIPTDAVTAMYQGQYTDQEASKAIASPEMVMRTSKASAADGHSTKRCSNVKAAR